MRNKAERVVKRLSDESIYSPGRLNDRTKWETDLWFAIEKHLNRPTHWPVEYRNAYRDIIEK